MITLVTSNVHTGRVRRRHYPTADLARQAVDATLDGWYQRQQHGRRGPRNQASRSEPTVGTSNRPDFA
jgi:hypothetical protein